MKSHGRFLFDAEECRRWWLFFGSKPGRQYKPKGVIGGDDRRAGVIYGIHIVGEKEIRYIGKTADFKKRRRDHLNELSLGKHHNAYLQRVFNKARSMGGCVEVVILQECLPGMMNHCEQEWIAKGKASGWRLCNHTDGGDAGVELSADAKQRLSEISKKKWADPTYRERWRKGSLRRAQGAPLTEGERLRRQATEEANRQKRREALAIKAARRNADRYNSNGIFETLTVLTNANKAFVPLTRGAFAVVNKVDLPKVASLRWYLETVSGQLRPARKVLIQGRQGKRLMQVALGYQPVILCTGGVRFFPGRDGRCG